MILAGESHPIGFLESLGRGVRPTVSFVTACLRLENVNSGSIWSYYYTSYQTEGTQTDRYS